MGGKPIKKAFSFSYSKIKNYETCPRRYKAVDVDRSVKEEEGESLKWGNQVHDAFAKRISDNQPFPPSMADFEEYAQRLLNMPGEKHVELKLAIMRDLKPCTWFDKKTYFRGIADFLGINPAGKAALAIDYKTGKIVENSEQLSLMAECIFSHYPTIDAVRTEFWWLKEDAVTRADFYRKNRKETWRIVLPKALELERAHEQDLFPPKPGGLCRAYCPVTSCEHNGRR